jgi:hypothetical protein
MKVIQGTFLRPDGSPAAGALLEFLLSHAATNASVGHVLHSLFTVTLDGTGSVPPATQIWCNDELVGPGGVATTYRVVVKDPTFGTVFDEIMSITGQSPINLNAIP